MAVSKADMKAKYPLPVYNYKVTVDNEEMAFSEVSGLVLQTGAVILYKHGLSFKQGEHIQKTSSAFQKQAPVTLTLRRGIVNGNTALFDWGKAIKTMMISLCDETGTPVVAWKIGRAMATKLSAPSFNAGANEVAIESLEVYAKDIEIEHFS